MAHLAAKPAAMAAGGQTGKEWTDREQPQQQPQGLCCNPCAPGAQDDGDLPRQRAPRGADALSPSSFPFRPQLHSFTLTMLLPQHLCADSGPLPIQRLSIETKADGGVRHRRDMASELGPSVLRACVQGGSRVWDPGWVQAWEDIPTEECVWPVASYSSALK